MQTIERTGKTIAEAVEEGIRELGVERGQVEIEVVEEATKGILGLLSKPARVRLKVKETMGSRTRSFVREVLAAMELSAEVNVEEEDDQVRVDLRGGQLGVLIGRRGDTLDSFQYLVNLAMNRGRENMKRIVVDVEDYRMRREEALRQLAGRMAEKARQKGRSVVLEPMSAMERRIIHTTLQGRDDIYTFSEGEEPFRKIVISPRRAAGSRS